MAAPDPSAAPIARTCRLGHGSDGPSPTTPQEAAERATEAVRQLGQTTTSGYRGPAELYAVVVELTLLVRGLPKALGQAVSWLEAEHEAGHLACDDSRNLTLTVHSTLVGLNDATRYARPLLHALNIATRDAAQLRACPQARRG